jgi:glucuronoxylan 4-O-methyltransferase
MIMVPTLETIIEETKGLKIQMKPAELLEIVRNIVPPANLLVFGLGNDSTFWERKNPRGRTVFLEDQDRWIRFLSAKHPFLEVHKIQYGTRLSDWKSLLDHPDKLKLDLPETITSTSWDMIIVDGPAGFHDRKPGRMNSIFAASQLVKKNGDVFVHDSHRKVERAYCQRYLLDQNLKKSMLNLSHYKLQFK